MASYLALITVLSGGGGGGGNYPDNTLPGPQPPPGYPSHPIYWPPYPDNSLPPFPAHPIAPGGGRPPGYPSHPIFYPPYPDQGLPPFPAHPIAPGGPPLGIWGPPGPWPGHPIAPGGPPAYPSHPIFWPPYPDNTLPGSQPRPDNTLPGEQPYPDNTLPPVGTGPVRPTHPWVPPAPTEGSWAFSYRYGWVFVPTPAAPAAPVAPPVVDNTLPAEQPPI